MPGAPERRVVEVSPERLAGWLDRFVAAHGEAAWSAAAESVTLTCADGAQAACAVPFPPLPEGAAGDPRTALVGHATAERTVGVLLVRRGGFAVGVFVGTCLVASKVGSRHVQGRTAAGGWSQQRFARRREQQARQAFEAAADTAAAMFAPYIGRLGAVVTGGDRAALTAVLGDCRLAPLRPLIAARVLNVPDPRQRVLLDAPTLFRAVHIEVDNPS